jgi:transcriptional regulator
MYRPKAFREDDPQRLAAFVRGHSFATVITVSEPYPVVSHIPLRCEPSGIGPPMLLGHVARANEHARLLEDGAPTTAVFHGPHAAISPTWYVDRPAVPTWNYAVVHAQGRPRAIEDEGRVDALLDALTIEHEPAGRADWLADLPSPFRANLRRAIFAFEIVLESFEGKFKLSQNRSEVDQHAVIDTLAQSSDPAARAVSALAAERLG